ncbi:MAG: hypothetical protein ACOC8F_04660 [Planctomycetota bacterium]
MTHRSAASVLFVALLVVGGCTRHYLNKADDAMAEQRFVEALKNYRKALDTKAELADQPEFAANLRRARYLAAHQQGRQLASRGAHEAAIDKFRRALEINPDYAPAQRALEAAQRQAAQQRLARARAEADAGRLDEARAQAARAIELDPDNAAVAEALASVEGRIGPELQAAESLLVEARRRQAQKHWQQAAETLEAALRANPNHLPCRVALHRARRTLDHARALADRGAEQLAERRLDEAIASLEQAVSVWPKHPEAPKQLERARAERRRADALHDRAVELVEQSRWDEALAKAREALQVYPQHPRAGALAEGVRQRAAREHTRLGRARLEEGKLADAETHFRQALQYVETRAAHEGLAEAALARGREAERRDLFANALLWYMDAVDEVRDRATLRKVAQMRARLTARVAFAVFVDADAREGVPCEPGVYSDAVETAIARNAPAYLRRGGADLDGGAARGAAVRYRAELEIASFASRRRRVGSERRVYAYEEVQTVPNPDIPPLRRRLRRERRELDRLVSAGADADDIRHQRRAVRRIEDELDRTPLTVRRPVTVEWDYVVHTYRKTCAVRVELRLHDVAAGRVAARETLQREGAYEDELIDNANPRIGLATDPLELPSDRAVCRALLNDLAAETATTIIDQAARAQVDELRAEAEARAREKDAAGYIEAYCDAAILLEPLDAAASEDILAQLHRQAEKRRKVYSTWGEAPHDADEP